MQLNLAASNIFLNKFQTFFLGPFFGCYVLPLCQLFCYLELLLQFICFLKLRIYSTGLVLQIKGIQGNFLYIGTWNCSFHCSVNCDSTGKIKLQKVHLFILLPQHFKFYEAQFCKRVEHQRRQLLENSELIIQSRSLCNSHKVECLGVHSEVEQI